MAITRINNNQISDASAGNVYVGVNAAAKIQQYSITSQKIANNLVYGSDLTVSGNLTVNGQTTTIDTTVTTIEDPVILLASNQTGAPAVDIGFIGERGTSNNIAFVWDESSSEFVTVYTTDTETNTTVSISSYANFHTNDANVGGNLAVGGNISITGNVTSLNVTGNITGGNLLTPGVVTATGNVTGGNVTTAGRVTATGNVTGGNLTTSGITSTGSLAASTTISATGNVAGGNLTTAGQVVAVGNITGAYFFGNGSQLTGVTASSVDAGSLTGNTLSPNVIFSSLTTVGTLTSLTVSGNTSSGNVSASGNITGGNIVSNALVSGTTVTASGNVNGGNVNATTGVTSTTVTATGNVTGGNLTTTGITSTGSLTASTTVTATGNITGGNLTTAGQVAATGNVTGGNVITAGQVSATGNVTGGNISAGSGIISTTGNINGGNLNATTGVRAATGYFTGNVDVLGNLNATVGVVYANSGIFLGDAVTGNNAAFAGIPNFTQLGSNVVMQFAGNVNSYSQINFENINSGNRASTDYIATADNGTDTTYYLDMGINSSTFNDPVNYPGFGPNDSYVHNHGGNLILNPESSGKTIKLMVGGTDSTNIVANVSATGVAVTGVITANGNVTGGNLTTAGQVAATGNVSGGNVTTAGQVIATGNVTGGNISAGTGNVIGGNINSNSIVGTAISVTGTTVDFNLSGNISVSSRYITDLADPVQAQDAATKAYVDSVAQGLDVKASVTLASAAGLPAYTYNNGTSGVGATITGNVAGALSLDSTAVTANARVLIKNETSTNAPYNGIYVVTATGDGSNPYVLTRATDFDNGSPSGEIPGAFTFVEYGSTQADTGWVCTTNSPVTVGTTAITFVQFSGAGSYTAGNALSLSGSQFNVNTDGNVNPTIGINGSNQLVIPAGAVLTTPNIGAATGTSLSVSGNVTGGNINSNALVSGSTVTASGNVTGGNIVTTGVVSATGNITGGNLSGTLITGTLTTAAQPNVTSVGTLTSLTVTGNVAGGNITTGGNVVATGNLVGGNVTTVGIVSATGNVSGGNLTTAGQVAATGNVSGGNLTTAGQVAATGNVSGGNLTTAGQVSATGNVSGGNVTTAGQVSATGNITTVGNISGGNAILSGSVYATTFVGNISGNIDAAGANTNIQFNDNDILGGSNAFTFNKTSNAMVVSGNITGGNLTTTGITSTGSLTASTTITATGNVSGGNVTTAGQVAATGNITGGNVTTAGQVTATGNVTGGNLITTGLVSAGTTITATGNITGGNLITAGQTVSTGNVTGGNLITTGLVSAGTTITATGNITGGNLNTAGQVTATGNVTGGNVVATALVTGANLTATSNVTGANVVGTTSVTGANIRISTSSIDSNAARITINGADADVDFAVDGDTLANVFYVDAGTGTASFGSSAQTTNAVVAFNATNSILMPVGNVGQRPSTGVTGMVRFNSTSNALEVYDNSQWTTVGVPSFTVIADQQFNGDGSNVVFTLSSSQTTNSCIVSINGVVQLPTVAYSVSGTTLTFTEAPLSGDVIDVRQITTTTTVTSISNSSGNATVGVSDTTNDVSVTGDLIPTGNITQDLGSLTARWKDLYLSGSSLILGNIVMKNTGGNTVGFFGPDGTTPATLDANVQVVGDEISAGTSNVSFATGGGNIRLVVGGTNTANITTTGANITGTLGVTGNITGGNLSGTSIVGTLTTAAQTNITSVGTLGSLSVTANVAGGNLTTAGQVVATGNITGGNLKTSGVTISSTAVSATTLTGTLSTAAQTNITSVGTLGSLSVTANVTAGNLSVGTGTISGGNIVNTNANGVGNIGSSTTYFNTVFAKATSAQYADLAEKYVADAEYAPGTVVVFGGDKEVTVSSTDADRAVAGVVSTNPSYIMNGGLEGEFVSTVALTGRVPCRVTGTVRKGDLMVSAGYGQARAEADPKVGTVIGKALENYEGNEGVIEVVVGRF